MTILRFMLPGWQCGATCCWDDNAGPHIARMTMLGHILPGWHSRSSLTWDIRLFHIHHIFLISHPAKTILSSIWTLFLRQKIFHYKGEVKIAIKNFLPSTLLEFYHTDINILVNQWLKCIEVQKILNSKLEERCSREYMPHCWTILVLSTHLKSVIVLTKTFNTINK